MLRLSLLSSIGLLGFLAFKLRPKHRPPTLHTPSITTITDTPSSSSSSSSSSPPPFRKLTYDVFLSFRGEDTRRNFTDHLYAALKRKGIHTFRDGEQLEKGKSIAPELLKAIEESRYAIVVLSRNYANSSWCLDEIANIVDCMEKKKVLPVFYDVDPSDFRKQTGDHFRKAFTKHEKAFKDEPDKVQRWRRALFQVANLCGWHLKDDGYESEVIQEIVEKIFTELIQTISISEAGLVGMDYHLKEMRSYLDIECPHVRIIGICGMGGIGKTTIAEVVYEREKAQFEGYCFLRDVREVAQKQGVVHLQKQLLFDLLKINVDVQDTRMGKNIIKDRLCTKRVLIVLDDVDKKFQLKALCDHKWFGRGSRIIITSRNEHLLSAVDGNEVYKVNPLSDAEALQLFRINAFKEDHELVGEEILKLSKEFLKYANGLPLAIKVLGGSVNGRSVESWSSELDRLKNYPEEEIIDVLKVSFDGLRQTEKEIFLDIACFFKGDDINRVIRVLKGRYSHCPSIDVKVLKEKSMITLLGKKLWMHDLMQTLGREIVRQEYPEEPGKRSRLWLPKDIICVLDRSKATSAVQSISLKGPTKDDVVHSINDSAVQSISLKGPTKDDVVHSINDAFSNMDRLRLLKISNAKFSGNIKYLSNELQFLQWHDCPLDSFPSDFQPDNLVELLMYSSCIKQLWSGKKGWRMLQHIDMTGSQYLISTPDFTDVPFLEILVLEGCTSLVEVHLSLGFLKKLIYLNMRFCKSVEIIPPFTGLEALETLNLSLCSRLKKFPEIEGNMESLLELHLDGTSIEELSWFLVGMKNLKVLTWRGCKGAPRSLLLPASLSSLTSLIDLDLSYCNMMDGDIPDVLSSLISLRELDLSGNCFVRLPESFSQLSKLKTLYLRNCRQLKLVPKKLPLSLEYVHAQDCISLTDYPNQIKVLTSVESGETTVNSLFSFRTWSLYGGRQSKSALQSLSHPFVGIDPDDNEIPEWFGNTSTSNHISIPIGDQKWKGVATCAVFSVNTTTADVRFSNYWYQNTLETDAVSLKPQVIDWESHFRHLRLSSDLCLTYYEPISSFPKRGLNESTVVRARFETNNPFVVVQKCGIRLVYEQDAGWLLPGDEWIYLNKDQNKALLLSGWLSPGDKCLNWEKFIPPSEEDYSTHVLRMNIESVLPRYLEVLNHASAVYKFNLSGSSAWFHNVTGFFGGMSDKYTKLFPVPIEIPENLHKSKKWMGFAIQASIAVDGIAEEEREDNYRVDLILINRSDKNLNLTTGAEYHNVGKINIEYIRTSHDQLLVVYIPRAQVPEVLFAETSTTKMFVSFINNSHHVKFRTIGVRVVYQQDIQGFANAIIQCMQKENSLELYDKLVVEDWIELIRLQGGHLEGVSNPKERDSRTRREKELESYSQKYRNVDWSAPHHLHCSFYGAEIFKWKWFMHIEEGNSAEIPLPPNLLDDANWLGIAICAFSRLCPIDRDSSLGSASSNSKYNVVTCRLDCDGDVLVMKIPFTEFDASGLAKEVTWFVYIPPSGKWLKSWRWQGKLARATFSWSSKYLAMQSCALGLVYNKDVEHLVHTLTSCEIP